MDKGRLELLLNNCIEYIDELKERLTADENKSFWMNVIGMTENEIKYFSLDGE